jgi:hypothetical protein
LKRGEQKKLEDARVKAEEQAKLDAEKANNKPKTEGKQKTEGRKRHFSALSYYVFKKRDAYQKQRLEELARDDHKVKFTMKDADTVQSGGSTSNSIYKCK